MEILILRNQAIQEIQKKAEADPHTKRKKEGLEIQDTKSQVTQEHLKMVEADLRSKNGKVVMEILILRNQVTQEIQKMATAERHIRKEKTAPEMVDTRNLDLTMVADTLHTKSAKVLQKKGAIKSQLILNQVIKAVDIRLTKKENQAKGVIKSLVSTAMLTAKRLIKREKAIAETVLMLENPTTTAEMQMIKDQKDLLNQRVKKVSHSDQNTIRRFKLENHTQIERRN